MYGYRTKHKILKEYLSNLTKIAKNGEPNYDHFVFLKEFSRQLGKTEKKAGKVAQYLSNMALEGLFELKNNVAKNDMQVTITSNGVNAALSETYTIKQNEFFWKAFMNITMTLANVAVAITAIWALTKETGESKILEERMKLLEQVQKVKEVKANPSSPQTQDYRQPNSKYDLQKKSD